METISLSVHPNDTHLYFEQNHEPKNEPRELPGGSTLLHAGEGRGPLPNPYLLCNFEVSCYELP